MESTAPEFREEHPETTRLRAEVREARAEIARLTAERDQARMDYMAEYDARSLDHNEREGLKGEIARLTAERDEARESDRVGRLAAREEAHGQDRWRSKALDAEALAREAAGLLAEGPELNGLWPADWVERARAFLAAHPELRK